jgi:hypothetical protein
MAAAVSLLMNGFRPGCEPKFIPAALAAAMLSAMPSTPWGRPADVMGAAVAVAELAADEQ